MSRYILLVTFISGELSAMGALTGLAIGDAMGAPFEGYPPAPSPVREMQGSVLSMRKAGHFTDDTLQAIAVAESLLYCRGFCGIDLIRRLIGDYYRHPEYYGPTSRAVFEQVISGIDPDRAALVIHDLQGGSRSNGSVMRGAPVGIFYGGTIVRDISLRCSRLTHADPVAGECSAWVNQMISSMCRGSSRTGSFTRALQGCGNDEVLHVLGSYHRFDPEPGLDALLATHAALAVFMQCRSFEEAVVKAVGLGGDTDTVGAIAGSLAGAWYGIGGIPARWLVILEDGGTITSLAAELWRASATRMRTW